MNATRLFSVCIPFALISLAPFMATAESYVPLTEFAGLQEAASAAEDGNFSELINVFYRAAIGLGSIAAILLLVLEGFRYATVDAVQEKTRLRGRITMILGGLFVLIGAYAFLMLINPDLTNIKADNWMRFSFAGVTISTPQEPRIFENVTFESGMTGEEALASVTTPTVERYREIFGRSPSTGQVFTDEDGTERVRLSTQERRQIIQQASSGGDIGISSESGRHVHGDVVEEEPIDVTANGQQAVAAAITLCPEIPEEWADSPGLYKIIARESGGIVGRPNYALEGYMEQEGISKPQIASDIRNNSFYYQHCCRVTSQSTREARENGISSRCNPDTQSGLMDYTRAQANAGTNGYGHIAGMCTSAAGVGQLLNYNMHEYHPSGIQGFNDASEEICGMLKYIKAAYGDPASAWNRYKTGIGY